MLRIHPEDYKTLGENGMWKLSEIFNDVVLRQPNFVKLSKQPEPDTYAETKEELERYMKTWKLSPKVTAFINEYLSLP
jgi:hypothetical protein